MATIENLIQGKGLERIQAIALNLGSDPELIKGMAFEDFQVKYPESEFNVFTQSALSKYEQDLSKSIENDLEHKSDIIEKAKRELGALSKKTIVKNGIRSTVYVGKKNK